ncbi:flagellar basal-body rod protein FlgF [Marinomonas agarivorans]|nr:flagellar basal-body rod protein FlgF [Marinomonas agarivorans]
MDRALYLAMSGGKQIMQAQTIRANNLANVNTNGFRADYEQARSMPIYGDHYASRVYAMSENPATRYETGALVQTDRALDVALEGSGFIAVLDKQGNEAYTRSGSLQITASGQLVNGNGLPVMGVDGPIFLPPIDQISIGNDGSISIVPEGGAPNEIAAIAQIKLVNPDIDELEKGNDGLIRARNGELYEQDFNTSVVSGFVESSNVNAVEELTKIMNLSRQFEMNIKVMDTVRDNGNASARILQRSS